MVKQTLSENITFESNILTDILGSNLTENLSIVFAEQIKNAKDANATIATIDLSTFKQSIIISDNGEGIKSSVLKDTWLRAGTTNKRTDVAMLGGKGIGRFTLFALGDKIEVTTIVDHEKSKFILDKELLAKQNNLSVPIEISSTNETNGTRIEISKVIIEVIDLEEIQRDLKNLILDSGDFKFTIIPPKGIMDVSTLIPFEEGIKYATLESKFKLTWNNDVPSIEHTSSANLLNDKVIISQSVNQSIRAYVAANKDQLKTIGNIKMHLYHFYSPNNIVPPYKLADSKLAAKDIANNFLYYAQGINIYRNNFKIFGYGVNDWLGLDNTARNYSDKISNSRTVAQVVIDDNSSELLVEKSSREGLITTNTAFKVFKEFILNLIDQINDERKLLKDNLKRVESKINIRDNDHNNTHNEPIEKKHSQKNTNKDQNKIETPVSKKGTAVHHSAKEKTNVDKYLHPKIVLADRSHNVNCHTSINLYKFIDFDKSISENGKPFKEDELVFIVNGSIVSKGNLPGYDVPQRVEVVIKSKNTSAVSSAFNLNIIANTSTSGRNELFPLNGAGKHFRLESDNHNDFFKVIMNQINELWTLNKFDFVVNTAIRSITDVEIDDRFIMFNNTHKGEKFSIENLPSGFNAIEKIVNKVVLDNELKKKVSKALSLDKNGSNNFYRKFTNSANRDQSGSYFKSELQKGHTGAHKPNQATNPNATESLCSNTVAFLELCEGYIAVLEQNK